MTAAISVTTIVDVDRQDAFEVFTRETDSWWRRGPRFRFLPDVPATLRFEGEAGGRLIEVDEAGSEFEVGRILVWKPGELLRFEFRALRFEPGQTTEVEVRFEPVPGGTRVSIDHRGWESLAEDHPARHGLTGPAFDDMISVWWGDLLVSLLRRAGLRSA